MMGNIFEMRVFLDLLDQFQSSPVISSRFQIDDDGGKSVVAQFLPVRASLPVLTPVI